jgi:phosphoglucosamine mutase
MFHELAFGLDGIRGIAGNWPFTLPAALQIGQALGQYVQARSAHPSVVIGRDTRPSGTGLLYALASGLMEQGVDVTDLDIMTTPGVAYCTRLVEADLGVVVSASHSSYEYNGIKVVNQRGLRLQREDELEIEKRVLHCANKDPAPADEPGQEIDGHNLIQMYVEDHVKCLSHGSLAGLCVVLDCANGAAARVAPEVFRRLGANVVAIHDQGEGISINHRCGSEYVRECPADLGATMEQCGAAYGLAFDGDGDRLVVVDDACRVYDGHDLLFVLARHFSSTGALRHNTVVTTHRANRGLEASLRECGIQTVYTRNGDKYVEAEMWGRGYYLGGDAGGNIIINDKQHTAADTIYTGLVLGHILMLNRPAVLRDLLASLHKHPQVTLSIDVRGRSLPPRRRNDIQTAIAAQTQKFGPGSRVEIWDSSTEPGVVRVMVEGVQETPHEQVVETAKWFLARIQEYAQ